MVFLKKNQETLTRVEVISTLEQVNVTVLNRQSDSNDSVFECTFKDDLISIEHVKTILESKISQDVHPPRLPDIIAPDYNETVYDENDEYNPIWEISNEHSKQMILEFYARYVSMYTHSTTVATDHGPGPPITRFAVKDLWSTLTSYWYRSEDNMIAENMFFFAYQLLMDKIMKKHETMIKVLEMLTKLGRFRSMYFNVLLLRELCHQHFKIQLYHYSTYTEKENGTLFTDRDDSLIHHVSHKLGQPPSSVEADKSLIVISTTHCDDLRICVRHCPDIDLCNDMLRRLVTSECFWTDKGLKCDSFPDHYPFWSYRNRLRSMAFKPAGWQEQSRFKIKNREVYSAPSQDVSLQYMEKMDTVMEEHSYDFYKYGVKCFQLNQSEIKEFAPQFPMAYPRGCGTVQPDSTSKLPQHVRHYDSSSDLKFNVQSIQKHDNNSSTFELLFMSQEEVQEISNELYRNDQIIKKIQLKIKTSSQISKLLKHDLGSKSNVHVSSSRYPNETSNYDDVKFNMYTKSPKPSVSSRGRVLKRPSQFASEHPTNKKKIRMLDSITLTGHIVDICFDVDHELKQHNNRLQLRIQEAVNLNKHDFRGLTEKDDIALKIKPTQTSDKFHYLYHTECNSDFAINWPRRHLVAKDNHISTALAHVDLSGINTWMDFLAVGDSLFPYHNENEWLGSINYCSAGKGKVWYVIPANEALEFEEWLLQELDKRFKDKIQSCRNASQHKDSWIDVAEIPTHFTVTAVYQKEGMFVVTAPGALHFGVNVAENFCTAINFCSPQWSLINFAGKICNGLDDSCDTTVLLPTENFWTIINQYCTINTQLDLDVHSRGFKIPQKKTIRVQDTVDKWIEDTLNTRSWNLQKKSHFKADVSLDMCHKEAMNDKESFHNPISQALENLDAPIFDEAELRDHVFEENDIANVTESNGLIEFDHRTGVNFEDDGSENDLVIDEDASVQDNDDKFSTLKTEISSQIQTCEPQISQKVVPVDIHNQKPPRILKRSSEQIKCTEPKCQIPYNGISCKGSHYDSWHYFYKCKHCNFIGNTHLTNKHMKKKHGETRKKLLENMDDKEKSETRFVLDNMSERQRQIKNWFDVDPIHRPKKSMKILKQAKESAKS